MYKLIGSLGIMVLVCLIKEGASNNSTSGIVGGIATSAIEPSHEICVEWCFNQTYQQQSASSYLQCMLSCSNTSLLRTNSGNCGSLDTTRINSGPSNCEPTSVRMNEFVADRPLREKEVYLAVTWSPCPVGLDDVTGYRISFDQVGTTYLRCHTLDLTRRLTNSDKKANFTYIFSVKFGAFYVLSLRSLPIAGAKDDGKEYTKPVQISSCEDIYNGGDRCHCSRGYAVPAPRINVRGYDVEVSTLPAKTCFEIEKYNFLIETTKKTYYAPAPYTSETIEPNGNERLRHTFHHMYDYNSRKCNMTAVFVLLGEFDPQATLSSPILIKPWRPPLLNVTELGLGDIEVSFPLSLEFSMIEWYNMSLSRITFKDNGMEERTEISSSILNASKVEDGLLKKRYYKLELGSYGVRVSEVRKFIPIGHHCFNDAKWGPVKVFEIKPLPQANNEILLAYISIPIAVCLITVVLLLLFIWLSRKGCLEKIPLPPGFKKILDKTTNISIQRRKILLVWQSDYRDTELNDAHEDNIRNFASYLITGCGQDVRLDLFKSVELNGSIAGWTERAYKDTDFVILVCPHFNVDTADRECSPGAGDFSRMYRYLERDFNKKKFITALLPYANIKEIPSGDYMSRMTTVFRLMDQIEDLFFHIQGISKVSPSGRINIRNVSKGGYIKTVAGLKLEKGIARFLKLLTSKEDYSTSSSIDASEGSISTENSTGSLQLSDAPLLPDSDGKDGIPSAVMLHSLEGIPAPLTLEESNLSNRKQVFHPPPPLVDNPQQMLELINEESARFFCESCTDVPSHSACILTPFSVHCKVNGYPSSSFFQGLNSRAPEAKSQEPQLKEQNA